jgi:ankyrin repeat protein
VSTRDDSSRFLAELSSEPGFEEIAPLHPNSRNAIGETPLQVAAIRGDTVAIEALLDAGAEINTPGEYGHTALHEAVGQGQAAVVAILLARGASITATNDDGHTPQKLAELLELHDIARLFHGSATA